MHRIPFILFTTAVLAATGTTTAAESVRSTAVEWEDRRVPGEDLGNDRRTESGVGDRRSLALTLYQQGPAQVAERREVGLQRGDQLLRLLGVPAGLQADTLMVTGEGSPRIHRARVRQGRLTPETLLAAHVGREIELVREAADGERRERTVRVIAAREGGAVVASDNGIEILARDSAWRPVFGAVPDRLLAEPALELEVGSELAGRQQLDVSYLADGLDWRVGYVVTISADAEDMDLGAWATLRNHTDAAFADADVRLVAGASGDAGRGEALASRSLEAGPGEPEAVAEQHRFRLPQPVTLEPDDEQQVRFLGAEDVPVTREYRTRGGIGLGRHGRGTFQPVTVHLAFVNEDPALGRPLPGGMVRVYQLDSNGEPVLAGEDRLRPTPTGEEAGITTGASFDLTAERRQTAYRRLDQRTEEQSWEIRLRNAGEVDRRVTVLEALPGEWTMLEESADHERPDSGTARWELDVPAGGEATLTYRAEIRR